MYLSRLFSVRCDKNLERGVSITECELKGQHAVRDRKGPRSQFRVGCTTACCQIYIYMPQANRDGIGSHRVLKKISCERNLRVRPFVNAIQSLEHLRARFVNEDQEMYPEQVKKKSGPHLSDTYNRYLSTQPSSRCGRKPTCAYTSIWPVMELSFSTRQAKSPARCLTTQGPLGCVSLKHNVRVTFFDSNFVVIGV